MSSFGASGRMPGMGYVPDRPDRRDRALYAVEPNINNLPPAADNRALMPTPMDQKTTGACVGYSGAAALHGVLIKDGHRRPFVPSPVFLYREARVLGGYVEEDGGAEIRLMWKAANKLGLPPLSNITTLPVGSPRDCVAWVGLAVWPGVGL